MSQPLPPDAAGSPTGALILADGTVFWGQGLGAERQTVGEVCFTTGMTGYQETLTDPSFAGQIVTFTFPHIGNVGTNAEDLETMTPACRGAILRAPVTEPSNWRAADSLTRWLERHGLPGLAGVDTRAITRRIRDGGAPNGVLVHAPDGKIDVEACIATARAWPGLEGMDLAKDVTTAQSYTWDGEAAWQLGRGFGRQSAPRHRVVAIDFGAKRNILRELAAAGCEVIVVPATATAEEIMRHQPAGIFLSNGPGDPAATGVYAVPTIQALMAADLPIFGICLGHQLLALALGAKTFKLERGHRGANHPVKDLDTARVEITSQNHGFAVDPASLPLGVVQTHTSLFDGTNEGLKVTGKPVFSVQHHPEASPGPHDCHHLFQHFVSLMDR
ncbi:MAG: carbamoyl-phosphate synthase small subunit [Alphaproteobacteria bacterium]|nr:MAG: carbamoyl-phosphate synthase small subunit [Alphaproteobacteria bacterium]